jgi:hypothetical protein
MGQRPLRELHKSQSQSSPRILPQKWDLFIANLTPYVGHPQFIQISPRRFYDAVKEWSWSPHIGHLPPKDGLKIDFTALNDLQLIKDDEYTFEDLLDPRLYGFDEACLRLSVLEPVVEMISRVGGEGVSEGDGRGLILRHGG